MVIEQRNPVVVVGTGDRCGVALINDGRHVGVEFASCHTEGILSSATFRAGGVVYELTSEALSGNAAMAIRELCEQLSLTEKIEKGDYKGDYVLHPFPDDLNECLVISPTGDHVLVLDIVTDAEVYLHCDEFAEDDTILGALMGSLYGGVPQAA
ncbi:hypothetical protein AB4254_10865 [Vibrio breoganii]